MNISNANSHGSSFPMESTLSFAWYETLYLASMATMSLGFSLRTEGRRNMPMTGPALVIANHQSFLDPTLVGLATRRHLVYLAKKSLFNNRFFGWLIRSLNAVPINLEGTGIEGIRAVIAQRKIGRAVLVFPEGNRTEDGNLQPFEPGIHAILRRVPAPVVPVGVAGAYDAWPRWRPCPIPAPLFLPAQKGRIGVSLGKPLDPKLLLDMSREQFLKSLFDEIRRLHARAEKLRNQE